MLLKPFTLITLAAAITTALQLTGSPPFRGISNQEARSISRKALQLAEKSSYGEALELFVRAATMAERSGDTHAAAMNWGNAGACALVELRYSNAAQAFQKARVIAARGGDTPALASAMNNMASLYIHLGEPESAARTAEDALRGPASHGGDAARFRPELRLQLALALSELHRFEEALPVYRRGIAELMSRTDFATAASALSSFAEEALKAGYLNEADAALNQGLRLLRDRGGDAQASILDELGQLRARQGNPEAASALFDKALRVPPGTAPRWKLFADRARFHLAHGSLTSAMEDFRAARSVIARMRLDMVPADQDRVGLESGLSEVADGLVEAGNRLALQTEDGAMLAETFDAAEQDRQWSLRALVPGTDDWRSRLPSAYWDLLVRYRVLERAAASGSAAAVREADAANDELKRMEAHAGGSAQQYETTSALAHVRANLDKDATVFSFHIGPSASWIWVIDRSQVSVYRLPPSTVIERQAAQFTKVIRDGSTDGVVEGRTLYRTLFGALPERVLLKRKWLIEPDGPLYSVPFAALEVNGDNAHPLYLIEKAVIQLIPGALLLRQRTKAPQGMLIAIGDPVYNGADPRYRLRRSPEMVLPRLPNTAAELSACSRAWGAGRTRTLSGADTARLGTQAVFAADAQILHFATHVVPSTRDFRAGLIALGLDADGSMRMMGPREILARPVRAALVVMNGCHSAQAEALPGAGLMGLTRAWIGAGAGGVLATQWDIPDGDSQNMMSSFYRALAAGEIGGPADALRQAQLGYLRQPAGRPKAALWAGYFLESREL